MTPSTRKEIYLNKIATGEGAIPTPATREEMYLAKIAGEEVEVPTPVTRVEMYLYKIGGGEIIVPTPATRLEMFLAAASGMPISTPVPTTREETLWDYIINGTNPQTITGVPPISFIGNGKPLISWSMKGNGSQTGTPTPDNPVMPTFCGVRTGNLIVYPYYDKSSTINNVLWTVSDDGHIKGIGTTSAGTNFFIDRNAFFKAGTYTIKIYGKHLGMALRIYDNITHTLIMIIEPSDTDSSITFTLDSDTSNECRIYFNIGSAGRDVDIDCDIMLNLGSTAKPYEPFGWAEKITNAGQTVPVYLGQTQTVRRIRKLVLDDTESWTYESQYSRFVLIRTDAYYSGAVRTTPCNCSHYQPIYDGRTIDDVPNESIYITSSSGRTAFNIKSTDFTSVTDFKAYLAAQYAAGTPVTVWYVLAEPETTIVNEPLAKIGDYADELHSEDTTVSIPTIKGQNTLTVEGDLQPSSMTITGYTAESQTMTTAKIMARANGMNINDKELESLSKKELDSILKGTVKSDGRGASSNR